VEKDDRHGGGCYRDLDLQVEVTNASKCLAIITARGGSKRIPRKNIREFVGRPIIAHSIESALTSRLFDKVIVSTDDPEIAEISRFYGAEVPFLRSNRTSGDFSSTADVLLEVLQALQSGMPEEKGKYDCLCCLYPTACLITADILTRAFLHFESSGADSLIPVVKFSFPPQRGFTISGKRITPVSETDFLKRSQDLVPIYHDCGQFYYLKISEFLKSGKILSVNSIPFILPETLVQDIDDENDWELARMKYLARQAKPHNC